MTNPRILFGSQEQAPITAAHFSLIEESQLHFGDRQVCLLLSRTGYFESVPDTNIFLSRSGHEGIAILFDRSVFNTLLEPFRPGLNPAIRAMIGKTEGNDVFSPNLPPALADRFVSDFVSPSISGPALPFYFEAKIKELIAFSCFGSGNVDGEFFCTRQKRLSMDRVARTMRYFEFHLDEPLDLAQLAEEVGCSSCYLSRTFSAATGMTISQYFRKRRIERAAELLVTGRYNVSEAATEVGYNSLSHFSKAFQHEKGCLPSQYAA